LLRGRLLAPSMHPDVRHQLRKGLLDALRDQDRLAHAIVKAWLDAGPQALLTTNGRGDVILWPNEAARAADERVRALQRWHVSPHTLDALQPILK